MKRIITAAMLFLAIASFAQNDGPPPAGAPAPRQGGQKRPPMNPEQRAKRETDKMNELAPLGTSFDKVLAVNTDAAKQRESIMGGKKRDELSDDQKAQLKQLNETHRKNLEAAMGKDLYMKWKDAEKARRQQQGGGQPRMEGGEEQH
jgi:hypothetical protein